MTRILLLKSALKGVSPVRGCRQKSSLHKPRQGVWGDWFAGSKSGAPTCLESVYVWPTPSFVWLFPATACCWDCLTGTLPCSSSMCLDLTALLDKCFQSPVLSSERRRDHFVSRKMRQGLLLLAELPLSLLCSSHLGLFPSAAAARVCSCVCFHSYI
jgi:hypothetical protein